jgi:hypothetical protein
MGWASPPICKQKKMSDVEDNVKVRVLLAQALFGNPTSAAGRTDNTLT